MEWGSQFYVYDRKPARVAGRDGRLVIILKKRVDGHYTQGKWGEEPQFSFKEDFIMYDHIDCGVKANQ